MAKRVRRTFTPLFKAEVVLAILSGRQSMAEACSQRNLKPESVSLWKKTLIGKLPMVFEGPAHDGDALARWQSWSVSSGSSHWIFRRKKSLGLAPLSVSQRREIVTELRDEFSRRLIAWVTDWPRSSLYHETRCRTDARSLDKAIRRLAGRWPTYGYRRLTAHLRRKGWRVNGKGVLNAMRRLGLAAKPHERVPRTTQSNHDFQRFPNLFDGLKVSRPDEVWVADITYLPLKGGGFCYLAGLMDRCSRDIVGWSLDESMTESLVLKAFKQAIGSRQPRSGLVHHTDRGGQYAGTKYRAVLRRAGIRQSMSRADNCYDNALSWKVVGDHSSVNSISPSMKVWRWRRKPLPST